MSVPKGLQELYQTAMKYAGEMHYKDLVTGTKANYLLHISNVTMEVIMAYHHKPDFDIELAMQTAILHDTVEDTAASVEDIERLFGSKVAIAVAALTKNSDIEDKNEKMKDSVDRINKLSKEVGMVKLADRITNLQAPPEKWDSTKRKNYLKQAEMMSVEFAGKNDYLNTRLLAKIEEYRSYL